MRPAIAAPLPSDNGLSDPTSYREAVQSLEAEQWREAMDEEYQALLSMGTWQLVDRTEAVSSGKGVIGCKWVYTKKPNHDGSAVRYKARLVIKGYQQVEGVDYELTYAPVSCLETLRLLIALAAYFDWKIDQLDVVTAFLNGLLEESELVYMEQPEG